jgi:diguanylate cyclase (GGDEF)-like protein
MVAKQHYEQEKFRLIFENSPIAIWEEDFSAVAQVILQLRKNKVKSFRKYFAEHPDLVVSAFRKIKIIDINRAALSLYGVKNKRELRARLGRTFSRCVIQVLMDEFVALAEGKSYFEAEFRYRNFRGKWFDVFMRVSVPQEYRKSLTRVIVTLQDIGKQKNLERHLKKVAQLDGLTKLLNQREISRRLEEELVRSRRYGLDLSCLMIDVDHFKIINDKYGHPKGDQILKRVAIFLKESIRRSDIIGRYGGDEFLLILPQTSPHNAKIAATRVKEIFSKKMAQYQKNAPVQNTLSIGISGFPNEGIKTYKNMIVQADKALYLAKASGRDTIVVI